MKPFTEPSAYRDTMSPMWRKLDLCSGIFTEDMFHTRSCFSIYEQIHTLQRLQFGISHQIRRHSSRSAARQSRSSKVKAQEEKQAGEFEKSAVFLHLINFFLYVRETRSLHIHSSGGGDCRCHGCEQIPFNDKFFGFCSEQAHWKHKSLNGVLQGKTPVNIYHSRHGGK